MEVESGTGSRQRPVAQNTFKSGMSQGWWESTCHGHPRVEIVTSETRRTTLCRRSLKAASVARLLGPRPSCDYGPSVAGEIPVTKVLVHQKALVQNDTVAGNDRESNDKTPPLIPWEDSSGM